MSFNEQNTVEHFIIHQLQVELTPSVKPSSDDNGRLLWHALGAQTTALIHEHIHVSGINHDMDEMILNAEVIDELMNKKARSF